MNSGRANLYQEALKLYKKSKITNLNKIKELLSQQFPGDSVAVENAILQLKQYRKKEGLKLLIIGIILSIAAAAFGSFLWHGGGIIDMAILGGLIGGGLGALVKGVVEYFKMR